MATDVPRIGLGTSGLGVHWGDAEDDPAECVDAVATALELGYRHVDTAQMYRNEHLVGEGLARADVPREDVFLATKVHPENLAHDDVLESTRGSLEALGTDSVDLLYVHWPTDAYDPADTLPAFDQLREDGAVRHLGLSNFTVELLEEARELLESPVAAVQFQLHPKLPPTEGERAELLEYAAEHDIDVVAWSPLVSGQGFDIPEVRTVAERRDATPAQVILAWLLGHDVAVIPKSASRAHLEENLGALDLELDEADVALIESVEERTRLFDRADAPWNR